MVYYPQKSARIRVAFDCSIEYNYCLNKEVLQGTDLTNQLIGILLRFRQGEVAVIVDIDALPSQVTRAVPRLPLIAQIETYLEIQLVIKCVLTYLEPRYPLVVQILR